MTRLLTLSLLCVVLFFFSCSRRDLALFNPSTYFPKEVSTDTALGIPNTTPDNLFDNLKAAYNKKSFALYQRLLSPDFRFYMSPSYVGAIANHQVSPPDPETWTACTRLYNGSTTTWYYKSYEQDINVMRKMLDPAGKAKSINLFFQASLLDRSRLDTLVYRIEDIELSVELYEFPWLVETHEPMGSEFTTVTLIRGRDSLWQIVEWFDNTLGSEDAF